MSTRRQTLHERLDAISERLDLLMDAYGQQAQSMLTLMEYLVEEHRRVSRRPAAADRREGRHLRLVKGGE